MNHPVHIIDGNGEYSQSAFIPFCSFGENMKEMGTKIDTFDVPVCNSFKPKIYKNQLCYQVDLEKFKDKQKLKKQLKLGLDLLLDYNEERQSSFGSALKKQENISYIFNSLRKNNAHIHLDTISNFAAFIGILLKQFYF